MSGSDFTTTPNHGFVLPAYDADEEEWGYHLTQNWSAVDALLATTGTTVAFLPLSGGMMTGGIALPNDPATALGAATKQYVDAHAFTDAASDGNVYGRLNGAWAQAVALTGGTMTGPLTLSGDPSAAQQAATKNYVDIHSGQVFVGPSAPTTPNPNSFWWCSNDGQLYLFYNDGNSTQFVPATSGWRDLRPPRRRLGKCIYSTADAGQCRAQSAAQRLVQRGAARRGAVDGTGLHGGSLDRGRVN
jgi:hypothetical protein